MRGLLMLGGLAVLVACGAAGRAADDETYDLRGPAPKKGQVFVSKGTLKITVKCAIVAKPGIEGGENPKVPEAVRAAVFQIPEIGQVHPELVRVGPISVEKGSASVARVVLGVAAGTGITLTAVLVGMWLTLRRRGESPRPSSNASLGG